MKIDYSRWLKEVNKEIYLSICRGEEPVEKNRIKHLLEHCINLEWLAKAAKDAEEELSTPSGDLDYARKILREALKGLGE